MNFYDCDRDFTVYSQRFIAYPRYVDENGVPRFDGNATRYALHSTQLNANMFKIGSIGSILPNYLGVLIGKITMGHLVFFLPKPLR